MKKFLKLLILLTRTTVIFGILLNDVLNKFDMPTLDDLSQDNPRNSNIVE